MKYLTYDLYKEFTCIGGDCPNTCCAFWKIFVDDDSADYYRSVPGPFGRKLKDNLITDDSSRTHIKLHDGVCPFLTDAKLCQIYQELGEDKLCTTCSLIRVFSGSTVTSHLLDCIFPARNLPELYFCAMTPYNLITARTAYRHPTMRWTGRSLIPSFPE